MCVHTLLKYNIVEMGIDSFSCCLDIVATESRDNLFGIYKAHTGFMEPVKTIRAFHHVVK